MKNRLDISESTAISMPMKNLIAIVKTIAKCCVGTYFNRVRSVSQC